MQKKLAITRTIAVLLGILLIIAVLIIVHDMGTIKDLRSPAKQNITAQRDIIRQDCSATDADSKARCADDLQNLSDLLAQFSKGTGTAPTQAGVSNVQVQTVPVK